MRFHVTDQNGEAWYVTVKWRPVALDWVKSAWSKVTLSWWLLLAALLVGLVIGRGCTLPPIPWPPPGPGPTPMPPKPVGMQRVLVVYESAAGDFTHAVYHDGAVQAYLKEKVKGEHRLFDKDLNPTNEAQVWQEAMRLPRPSIPCFFVQGTNGQWVSAPLPPRAPEFLAMLKSRGG